MGRRKREDIPPSAAEIEMYEEQDKEMNNYEILEDISDIIDDIWKRLDKIETIIKAQNNEK